MIKHIFKTIWNERKINAWILLELVVVFCILWFCMDYMSFTLKGLLEPKGFDINHTYRINISMKDEGRKILSSSDAEAKEQITEDIWTIYDRIEKYPAIEAISFSNQAYPYTGSYSSTSMNVDSVNFGFRIKSVTPGFFDVFKIKLIHGTAFNWENIATDNPVIISANNDNLFADKNPEKVELIGAEESARKVIGVAERNKRIDYEPYEPIMYSPIKRWSQSIAGYRELCIRVKPEADKNFRERFAEDMRSQLQLGYYYLSGIEPISKAKEEYLGWSGYGDNFKSIYSITIFLVINIFLGVIGTFWFRIQSRRSEIGLRLALGASKANVKKMFIAETFMLLFLASIIASIVCVNIAIGDIVKMINVPVPARGGGIRGRHTTFNKLWINIFFFVYHFHYRRMVSRKQGIKNCTGRSIT